MKKFKDYSEIIRILPTIPQGALVTLNRFDVLR
jgi:hypothetical protein